MFKQPADNPNSTPQEEKEALERARPAPRDTPEDREQAAALARRFASESGKAEPGPEEHQRAAEVIRNRRLNIDSKP